MNEKETGTQDIERTGRKKYSSSNIKGNHRNYLLQKDRWFRTCKMLQQLPRKAKLTNLINAAQVIIISKSGKPPDEFSSDRNLESYHSKDSSIVDAKKLILMHQFGFRDNNSRFDQVNK